MAGFIEGIKAKIKNIVEQEDQEGTSATELKSLQNIMQELEHLPDIAAKFLASFAFILCRVAYADGHVSPEEMEKIKKVLVKWDGLTEKHTEVIANMARMQHAIFSSTDNYLVVREFKEIANQEQINQLLYSLFEVAASDDSITSAESDTICMITKELGLTHDQFIAMRSQFRDKLEALK
ncbi:MAG: TerB family tellurite resistance protein [bacterium]|nr:TerB family tellurite resistance protein [bacterium]MBU1918007.1 TerB family tellurite resistance protein [bacterium]